MLLPLLLSGGCRSDLFFERPNLPEDIAFFGAYYRGPTAGVGWAGTELLTLQDDAKLELELNVFDDRDESVLAVIGFRAGTLGDLSTGDLEGHVLSPAGAECSGRLPTPDFQAVLQGDGDLEPALSIPGLDGLCKDDLAFLEPKIELRCGVITCFAASVEVQGCGFAIRAPDCGLSLVDGRRLSERETCVEPSLSVTCRKGAGASDALLDLECEVPERSCQLRAFRANEARLSVESHRPFGEVSDFPHPGVGRLSLASDDLHIAYVSDIAIDRGRLVAVWHGGRRFDWSFPDPPPTAELWFFEPETMEVVRTATIPTTKRLAVGGASPALHGIGLSGDQYAVHRFDDAGRIVGQTPLGVPWARPGDGASYEALELVAEPGRDWLVAVFRAHGSATVDKAVVIESATSRVIRAMDLTTGTEALSPISARFDPSGELVWILDTTKSIEWIDLASGETRSVPINPAGVSLSSGSSIMDLFIAREAPVFLVGVAGGSAGISRWQELALSGRAPWFDRNPDFNVFAPEADSRGRVLVAGVVGRGESDRLTAVAAEYELGAERFLSGTVELGVGAASRIVPWGDGHFVLLPWSATIAHVTPIED